MMRRYINIVESIYLTSFEKLAQRCDTVEQFLRKTDGMNVLYRGHYDDETPNHAFMTDYIGHALEYAGDEGRIDAFVVDPNDVMYFSDLRFDEMRSTMARLSDQQLATTYKNALDGNRFADEFLHSFPMIKKIIRGDTPYSIICRDPSQNDPIVPLLQAYAEKHGKNIIAFHGNDYADYGGQTEYVVRNVSKLVDLRKFYINVRARME